MVEYNQLSRVVIVFVVIILIAVIVLMLTSFEVVSAPLHRLPCDHSLLLGRCEVGFLENISYFIHYSTNISPCSWARSKRGSLKSANCLVPCASNEFITLSGTQVRYHQRFYALCALSWAFRVWNRRPHITHASNAQPQWMVCLSQFLVISSRLDSAREHVKWREAENCDKNHKQTCDEWISFDWWAYSSFSCQRKRSAKLTKTSGGYPRYAILVEVIFDDVVRYLHTLLIFRQVDVSHKPHQITNWKWRYRLFLLGRELGAYRVHLLLQAHTTVRRLLMHTLSNFRHDDVYYLHHDLPAWTATARGRPRSRAPPGWTRPL